MTEPIRIAQVLNIMDSGGIESVVLNYYRYIDKTKIQFDFYCSEDSTIPYEEEILSMGACIYKVCSIKHIFRYIKQLSNLFQTNHYKIVHVHMNTLSIFAIYAAKKANVPIRIIHNHSTTNKKEKLNYILKEILRPFSKLNATDYFCCSEMAGRWLFGNKAYDDSKVYLLKNAIDLEKFRFDETIRKKKREELNLDDDTLVVGHIGRFAPQKNHDFLIDIFFEIHQKYSDSILLLAGEGPLEDKVKEKVKTLNLDNNVIFLGVRNDVSELYQVFDVFLLPSLYEGLGMVLIEAQASGLPCVASTEVPLEAKISNNLYYLNLSDSIEVWVKTILSIYQNNKRMDHVNMSIIRNAGYDIKTEVKKLENKYFELCR